MTTLIRNEFLKLRTTRGVWLLLIAAQVVIVAGVSGAMISGLSISDPATSPKLFGHVGLVSLFTLVLGVMAVGGEYRHKTISDTFLATPRRGRVVVAKLAAYTVVGFAYGLVVAATCLAAAAIWFAAKGGSLDLSSSELWRTLGGGIVWNAAFAAVGVGIGALVRNQTAAIAAALVWIALVEGILRQIIGGLGRWLPFASGQSLGRLDGMSSGGALPQWAGGLVLAGYVALFAIVAVSFTIRRDVT
jgi:ABC-2 type transport system permease protein